MNTKESLLWRKTINQISRTTFCPTIVKLETIACVRLIFHDGSLSVPAQMRNLNLLLLLVLHLLEAPNGLRYPRWGGRRNAVRLEK